jgi:hypothetical protein
MARSERIHWGLGYINSTGAYHLHRGRLRVKTHKVPGVVVGGLRLGDLIVRFGLDGVDEVGELDRFLNEEDGDVVPD